MAKGGGTWASLIVVERARVHWVVRFQIFLLGVYVEYIFTYYFNGLADPLGPSPWLLNTVSRLEKNETGTLDLGINERHPAMPATRAGPLVLWALWGHKDRRHGPHPEEQAQRQLEPSPEGVRLYLRRPRPYRPVGLTVLFDLLSITRCTTVSSRQRPRCLILAGN
jgi:hypothetical protein